MTSRFRIILLTLTAAISLALNIASNVLLQQPLSPMLWIIIIILLTASVAIAFASESWKKSTAEQKADEIKSRRALLNAARQAVSDRQYEPLHQQALKELNLSSDKFARPWSIAISRPLAGEPHLLPPNESLSDEFFKQVYEVRGNLLILGNPGAGKSTELLILARNLLEKAEADDTFPVPIYFSLASWTSAPDQQRDLLTWLQRHTPFKHLTRFAGVEEPALASWLVQQLKKEYNESWGGEWLKQNKILPLLDGLDEVPEAQGQRAACVAAINAFRDSASGYNDISLVITSRSEDYNRLAVKLEHLSRIAELQPLTGEQINTFLKDGGTKLAGLKTAIKHDAELRKLAETPLFLTLMTMAYAGLHRAQINSYSGRENAETELFRTYEKKMFERAREKALPYSEDKAFEPDREKSLPYSQDQIQHWLGWLARAIDQGKTLRLEELQYKSLPKAIHWQYALLDRLGTAILGGLAAGSAFVLSILLYSMLSSWLLHIDRVFLPDPLLKDSLVFALIGALIGGLFGGTGAGLVSSSENWPSARSALLGFMIMAPVGAFFGGWSLDTLKAKAGVGVVFGLVGGLAGVFAGGPDLRPRHILMVETLTWTAAKARYPLLGGLLMGLALGSFVAFSLGHLGGLFDTIGNSLLGGSIAGIIGAFLLAFVFGWEGGGLDEEQITRHGLRRLSYNMWSGAFICWAVVLSLVLLLSGIEVGRLIFSLFGILIGLLAFGGYSCLSYLTLRYVGYFRGFMPWKYREFLEYCVTLIFLRKERGGYRFYHDRLQYYFARHTVPIKAGKVRHPLIPFTPLPGILKIASVGLFVVALAMLPIIRLEPSSAATDDPPFQKAMRIIPVGGHTVLLDLPIAQGQVIAIQANGLIYTGPYVGEVGPEGTERGFVGIPLGDSYDLEAQFRNSALLCRITGERSWRLCGARTMFTAPQAGMLEFEINGNEPQKRHGAFNVAIAIVPGNSP